MSDADALHQLATLLSSRPGYAFCNDCLAQRLSLQPSVAWAAAVALGASVDFEVDVGVCSHCLDQVEDVAHVRWVSQREEPTEDQPHRPRIRFVAQPTDDPSPGGGS